MNIKLMIKVLVLTAFVFFVFVAVMLIRHMPDATLYPCAYRVEWTEAGGASVELAAPDFTLTGDVARYTNCETGVKTIVTGTMRITPLK